MPGKIPIDKPKLIKILSFDCAHTWKKIMSILDVSKGNCWHLMAMRSHYWTLNSPVIKSRRLGVTARVWNPTNQKRWKESKIQSCQFCILETDHRLVKIQKVQHYTISLFVIQPSNHYATDVVHWSILVRWILSITMVQEFLDDFFKLVKHTNTPY